MEDHPCCPHPRTSSYSPVLSTLSSKCLPYASSTFLRPHCHHVSVGSCNSALQPMLCVTVSVSLESPSLATPLALVSQGFPEAGLPLGQPPAHWSSQPLQAIPAYSCSFQPLEYTMFGFTLTNFPGPLSDSPYSSHFHPSRSALQNQPHCSYPHMGAHMHICKIRSQNTQCATSGHRSCVLSSFVFPASLQNPSGQGSAVPWSLPYLAQNWHKAGSQETC